MSETVARGYVLIPAHNLPTNWLPEKKQEKKNTSVSSVCFLCFLANQAETREGCNSAPELDLGSEFSALPLHRYPI